MEPVPYRWRPAAGDREAAPAAHMARLQLTIGNRTIGRLARATAHRSSGHGRDGEPSRRQARFRPPPDTRQGAPMPAGVEQAIQRARGQGRPMPDPVRAPMEWAFGADFGHVRIHADAQADRLSRAIQARAFTAGGDVFFGAGAYAPRSPAGRALLAHELTHVVQQTGDGQRPAPPGENRGPFSETAALAGRRSMRDPRPGDGRSVAIRQVDGPRPAPIVRRAFGAEVELKVLVRNRRGPARNDGANPGDAELFEPPGELGRDASDTFNVVKDHNKVLNPLIDKARYPDDAPIVELVIYPPLDEYAWEDEAEGERAVRARFGQMSAFVDTLQQRTNGLKQAVKLNTILPGASESLYIGSDREDAAAVQKTERAYVQNTFGVQLPAVANLFQWQAEKRQQAQLLGQDLTALRLERAVAVGQSVADFVWALIQQQEAAAVAGLGGQAIKIAQWGTLALRNQVASQGQYDAVPDLAGLEGRLALAALHLLAGETNDARGRVGAPPGPLDTALVQSRYGGFLGAELSEQARAIAVQNVAPRGQLNDYILSLTNRESAEPVLADARTQAQCRPWLDRMVLAANGGISALVDEVLPAQKMDLTSMLRRRKGGEPGKVDLSPLLAVKSRSELNNLEGLLILVASYMIAGAQRGLKGQAKNFVDQYLYKTGLDIARNQLLTPAEKLAVSNQGPFYDAVLAQLLAKTGRQEGQKLFMSKSNITVSVRDYLDLVFHRGRGLFDADTREKVTDDPTLGPGYWGADETVTKTGLDPLGEQGNRTRGPVIEDRFVYDPGKLGQSDPKVAALPELGAQLYRALRLLNRTGAPGKPVAPDPREERNGDD